MSFNINQHHDKLLFIPLGGSGEIGLNLNLYHLNGKWIMIDMGAGFADDYLPGIDIIVPDISFIKKHRENLLGIIITHVHEDHAGALAYLWDELRCPIYATPFATAFLKSKFAESRGKYDDIKLKEVKLQDNLKLGPFDINMVALNHSAPEMHALYIKTEAGNIFHTGDWKFDHDPIIGLPNDEKLLSDIGEQGVDAVIGDSTNIFTEGFSGSEGDLSKSLETIVSNCKGMVAITTFASNLARIETAIRVAKITNRKLVVSGRSLWRMINAGIDAGYFEDMPEIIDERYISNHSRKDLLLLCTGCQGEPLAATSKIAYQNHPNIRFIPGDTIIFSSKIIPGNDKAIYRLFNIFVKLGVEVLTERDHFVHVSGHPARGELEKMYKLLRPKLLVPVHGELIHMHEHAKFGRSLGIPKAIEVENGDVIQIGPNDSGKIAIVEAGRLAVDGNYLLSTNSPVIKMRRRLRDNGIVIATVILNQQYQLLAEPIIKNYGVLDEDEQNDIIPIISEDIIDIVESKRLSKAKKTSLEDINNSIRSLIKKRISNETGKIPVIELHIEVVYP